jgi:adenylosuccinate synthase
VVNSSVSGLCITKLDVLDGLESLQLCVGYRSGSQVLTEPPLFADAYAEVEPVYEEMPGWAESTIGLKSFEQLPVNARRYLQRLGELVGVPIDLVSTGPDRDQTIVLRHPFGPAASADPA